MGGPGSRGGSQWDNLAPLGSDGNYSYEQSITRRFTPEQPQQMYDAFGKIGRGDMYLTNDETRQAEYIASHTELTFDQALHIIRMRKKEASDGE